ncbi:MAG TPA: hypothetical protein PK604_08450 [Acetivibrio clariflavus]|mgnify:CR=1 FL=1|nr:hypothetical protein [Acetivibrio clariflavus]
MKFVKLITLICIVSILTSCSGKVSKEPEATSVPSNSGITPQPASSPKAESDDEKQPDTLDGKLIAISREEAGLSTIEPLDFSKFSVNKRLTELLANVESYSNEDYKNGIVVGKKIVMSNGFMDEEILISERYKDNIINDIKIGTDMDYIKKVLGEPNIKDDRGFIFYKTKEYYLGFKGTSKVEYAILVNRWITEDKNILARIIKELDRESLDEIINSNQELTAFFDESGHINGGGWYANSYLGMEIVQFDSNTITIYNNYDGDLYSAKDFEYDIKYVDNDYQIENAIYAIDDYIAENKEFDTSGVLSPSGKLKSIYYWGYSMLHYFKIKTLDNSRPVFRVHVPAGDYRWLTDDYILYLNAWFSEPHIVRVIEDNIEDIDIMYKLGVYGDDDSQRPSFNFSIKNIEDNIITLYDSKSNKEYKVEYSIGSNGIEFKMAN